MIGDLSGELTITNMSEELFNDALYFKECSEETEKYFLQRRFGRISIICFCASAEAWINSIIFCQLKNKKKASGLSQEEQELLDYIEDSDKTMPNKFGNIRHKLYNFVPKAVTGSSINWDQDRNDAFEDYIALTRIRNSIVHYSGAKDFGLDEQMTIVKTAPDIIQKLFEEYERMGSIKKVPSWFKKRKSWIIEG